MKIINNVVAGLVAGAFVVCAAVNANADEVKVKELDAVVTGAYRCPGDNVGGLQHSIAFTTTALGNLSIETVHSNLDTGDCTPRGQDAITLTKNLGCTTGSIYPFHRGGGPGSAFGFVCTGKKSAMLDVIEKLSSEILRPTK